MTPWPSGQRRLFARQVSEMNQEFESLRCRKKYELTNNSYIFYEKMSMHAKILNVRRRK